METNMLCKNWILCCSLLPPTSLSLSLLVDKSFDAFSLHRRQSAIFCAVLNLSPPFVRGKRNWGEIKSNDVKRKLQFRNGVC